LRFDLDYRSAANAETLRPLDTHQVETVRGKRVETNLKFSDEGVSGSRLESNHVTPVVKDFTLENLYDLHSAFLYLAVNRYAIVVFIALQFIPRIPPTSPLLLLSAANTCGCEREVTMRSNSI